MKVVELKSRSRFGEFVGRSNSIAFFRVFRITEGPSPSFVGVLPQAIIDSDTGFVLPQYGSTFSVPFNANGFEDTAVGETPLTLFSYSIAPVAGGEAYDATAFYTNDASLLGIGQTVGVSTAFQSVNVPFAELREVGFDAPNDPTAYAYVEKRVAITETVSRWSYEYFVDSSTLGSTNTNIYNQTGKLHRFGGGTNDSGELWWRFDGGSSIRVDNSRFRVTLTWTNESGTPVLNNKTLPIFSELVSAPSGDLEILKVSGFDGDANANPSSSQAAVLTAYDPLVDKYVTPAIPWTNDQNQNLTPGRLYSRPPFTQLEVSAGFGGRNPAQPIFKAFNQYEFDENGWQSVLVI